LLLEEVFLKWRCVLTATSCEARDPDALHQIREATPGSGDHHGCGARPDATLATKDGHGLCGSAPRHILDGGGAQASSASPLCLQRIIIRPLPRLTRRFVLPIHGRGGEGCGSRRRVVVVGGSGKEMHRSRFETGPAPHLKP
jgi:hypothetical protein